MTKQSMVTRSVSRRFGRSTGSRGFTLLEVMIALALSAVSFLGILSLGYFNNILQFRTEQRSTALLLAETKMEEVRRKPMIELIEETEITVPFSRAKMGTRQEQRAVVIVRLFDQNGAAIESIENPDIYHFIKVEVEVTYTPRSSEPTQVRLVSWRAP